MRKMFLSTLALAVLLGAVGLCQAQSEPKPLVTVSFAGYDKVMADVDMIGQLGDNADLGQSLDTMLKMMTQGKGLAGLDTKQPWGLVVLTDSQQSSTPVIGFLPVTDLKQLVEVAKSSPLQAEVKLDGDVYEIRAAGVPIRYVTQKDKWAILSIHKEDLAKAPADPLKALGDLPGRYDLAYRVSLKNLPKEYREQLLKQLCAGVEAGMQQTSSESEEEYAIRLNVAKQMVQQLTTLINELDEVLLGWNVDSKTKSTYLDLELTAQTGTKLADQFAEIKPGKTNFAGLLLPGAAVTASSVGTLSDAQVAQANGALATLRNSLTKELANQGLSDDQIKLPKQLFGDVIDVLQKTVETKKTDGALSLLLEPKAATLVAGATIADGAKLEATLKQLVDEIKKDEEGLAKQIKLSAETYEGVRFHTLSMPVPDQSLAPLVGDTLEVVVGIADDKVLVAAGRDAAKTLKKAIDQSKTAAGKEVPPLRITLAATPIAKFLAAVGDEQVKATGMILGGFLEKAGDKDHITITAKPIPKGVQVRLEVEEGLLKALGSIQMTGWTPPGGVPAAGP